MAASVPDILASETIQASAPCRIDMGGTLDISSFYYPLAYLGPCTVNVAVDLRTTVSLHPHRSGRIKISSRGFEAADYGVDDLHFDHPLGLIAAIAAYFHIDGLHICIDSASPPRSALGGSSVAAVALIGAYQQLYARLGRQLLGPQQIALLAHAIEESIAGVPCGLQDQLAAVNGGINAWHWKGAGGPDLFAREELVVPSDPHSALDKSILLAYCGIPHASKNINSRWVRQWLTGRYRQEWIEIAACTKAFAGALRSLNLKEAVNWMNREVDIRCQLTPDVLDDTGRLLVSLARQSRCGARFCGAGGGGCIWALGDAGSIRELRQGWLCALNDVAGSRLFDVKVDHQGLLPLPGTRNNKKGEIIK